jgi:hypothetical protein
VNPGEKRQLWHIMDRLLQGLGIIVLPAIVALVIGTPVALWTAMAFVVIGTALGFKAIFRLYSLFQEIQVREIVEKAASEDF